MAYKINRHVIVNGEKIWIRANTEQEYIDKVSQMLSSSQKQFDKHPFKTYAIEWFELYSKPNVETATAVTYERQIRLYLIPHFKDLAVEDISVDDVQRLFNGIKGAKSTKQKVKIVLNMIFEAAIEDGIISRNPLKSRRLKITGKDSKTTKEYTVDQMGYLVRHIGDVRNPTDRAYLALQALHPMRLEEVLGLKWGDIDFDRMAIYISRAVTHPKRNRPEVKPPKTAASKRVISLSRIAVLYLAPGDSDEFVFGGKEPFSYQQVKRMCERIQKDLNFEERITPIRFRTTVLTDIYDQTKDVKVAQAAAGHTTSAMTLKHYIHGRASAEVATHVIDDLYSNG